MITDPNYCTIEQAEAIKSYGVRQDSLFSWFGDKSHFPEHNNPNRHPWIWISNTLPANSQDEDHRTAINCTTPIAAAWTAGELLQLIPDRVCIKKEREGVYRLFGTKNDFRYFDYKPADTHFHFVIEKPFAQALAGFLLYGLERNLPLFTHQEINKRLI